MRTDYFWQDTQDAGCSQSLPVGRGPGGGDAGEGSALGLGYHFFYLNVFLCECLMFLDERFNVFNSTFIKII